MGYHITSFQWNGLYYLRCTRLVELITQVPCPNRRRVISIAGASRGLHSKIGYLHLLGTSSNRISGCLQAIIQAWSHSTRTLNTCVVLRLTIRVRNPLGYVFQVTAFQFSPQKPTQRRKPQNLLWADSFSFYHVPGFLPSSFSDNTVLTT
jgi:hypothetical protein